VRTWAKRGSRLSCWTWLTHHTWILTYRYWGELRCNYFIFFPFIIMKTFHFQSWSDSLSFVPERGGIITSLKLFGREILFLNEETLLDDTKNVRGGIPILFPQAGPLPEGSLYPLKQHWFARNMPWKHEWNENEMRMYLESDSSTLKMFPYSFSLELLAKFPKEWVFSLVLKISNTWKTPIPISPWLHPYFSIANIQKEHLHLSWDEGELEDFSFLTWETVLLDNPWILKLHYDDGNILELDYSSFFKQVWVRSEDGKDFVCIEPIYGSEWSLLKAPFLLEPWKNIWFDVKISFLG